MVETQAVRPHTERSRAPVILPPTKVETMQGDKQPSKERPRVSIESKYSHEAIKAKKIQKIEPPPIWRERAEFLPQTADFFRRCGIDPNYVNPTPLGEGFTSVVFSYIAPDGTNKVVKVSRGISKGLMSTGAEQDIENIALVKKYFGSYAVPTEVRKDPESGKFVIVQDAVVGKPITNQLETQAIRSQLVDMARLNREMMRQTSHSLDFIGVPGFRTWLQHQVRGIITNKSEFEISNILVDKDGNLKIIDEGLLRFKDVPIPQRVNSNIGFLTNRLIMRLYFGVDLKPDLTQ